jgi:hypothetical protein
MKKTIVLTVMLLLLSLSASAAGNSIQNNLVLKVNINDLIKDGDGIGGPELEIEKIILPERIYNELISYSDFTDIANQCQISIGQEYLLNTYLNMLNEGEDDPLEEGELFFSITNRGDYFQTAPFSSIKMLRKLARIFPERNPSLVIVDGVPVTIYERERTVLTLEDVSHLLLKELIESIYDKTPFEDLPYITVFIKPF